MLGRCRWAAAALLLMVPLAEGCAAGTEPLEAAPADSREIVVMLHGLGRGRLSMWLLADRLDEAGFAVVRVGYDSFNAPLEEVLGEIETQIAACCAGVTRPVHFVGHSLGGLLIRAYLARHRPLTLGRVVLIDTPNQGTPLVDQFRDRWWLKMLGEPALDLGTAATDFPRSLPSPDYPVGIIAGTYEGIDNEDVLPGPDDGLVPVQSTRLAGMQDFLLVESSHWGLRYDAGVADQTIAFLRTGRFRH